jgi:hypothetical protein
MGWMTEEMRFDSWQGQEIFLFFTMSKQTLGPIQLPIQFVSWAVSPGEKEQWHDARHFPLSSDTVGNEEATSPPSYIHLHDVVLN